MANKKPMAKDQKLDLKSLSTNNYIAAVIALTILAVVIAGFIFYSLVNSIILNTKVIGHKNEAKKILEENVEKAEKLVSEFQALGGDKDLIFGSLPTDPDFPQLVAISESMANSAGVRLTSAAPARAAGTEASTPSSDSAATNSASQPKPYLFSITVVGNYAGMAKLMENLQLSARPMRVVDTQFKGETSELKAEITIETYYQDKADISTKTGVVK